METKTKQTENPALYRELSTPLPSMEVGNEALEKFYEEVGELRKKHRIPDVIILVSVNIVTPEGEGEFPAIMSYGSLLKREGMLAYALGKERQSNRNYIATLVKS